MRQRAENSISRVRLCCLDKLKLAESIGMKFECMRKGYIYECGEWTDHLVYYKNSK